MGKEAPRLVSRKHTHTHTGASDARLGVNTPREPPPHQVKATCIMSEQAGCGPIAGSQLV